MTAVITPEDMPAAEPPRPETPASIQLSEGAQADPLITTEQTPPAAGTAQPESGPTTGMPAYPHQFSATPTLAVTPPPTGRRTLLLVLGIVAAAVVLLGGGTAVALVATGQHRSASAAAPASTAASGPPVPRAVSPTAGLTSAAPTTSAAVDTHPTDLAQLLIPAPAGARPWSNKPTMERLDLTGAAAYGTDTDLWRGLLVTDGFAQGIARRWATKDGRLVEVTLFQFRTPWGAQQFGTVEQQSVGHSPDWMAVTTQMRDRNAEIFGTRAPDTAGYLVELGTTWASEIFVQIKVGMEPPMDDNAVDTLLTAERALL